MPQMIRMTHPGSPGAEPAVTSQSAYDKVWAPKGWEVHSVVESAAERRAARRAERAARTAPRPARTGKATTTPQGSDA